MADPQVTTTPLVQSTSAVPAPPCLQAALPATPVTPQVEIGHPGPSCAVVLCHGWPKGKACGRRVHAAGLCSSCYPAWRKDQIQAGGWTPKALRTKKQRKLPVETVAMRLLRAYRKSTGTWPDGATLVAWCPPDVRRAFDAGLLALLRHGRAAHFIAPTGPAVRRRHVQPCASASAWLPVPPGEAHCAMSAPQNGTDCAIADGENDKK